MPKRRSALQRFALPLAALALAYAPLAAGETKSLVGQAKTSVVAAADKVWHGTQDLAVYALGLIGVVVQIRRGYARKRVSTAAGSSATCSSR